MHQVLPFPGNKGSTGWIPSWAGFSLRLVSSRKRSLVTKRGAEALGQTAPSGTFGVACPVGERWALSCDSGRAVMDPSISTELLFFLLLFIWHRPVPSVSPRRSTVGRAPWACGALSVHGVSVTVDTTPHGFNGAPALTLQHLLQVGAGAAGLSVAVGPGHQTVEALGVGGKGRWC